MTAETGLAIETIAFPFRLSFQVASFATAVVAAVGVPLAYLLAMREFKGKSVLDALLMLPLVLPPVVTGYYLLLVIGRNGLLGRATEAITGTPRGLTFTWQAAVIASAIVALPLAIKTGRSAIEAVDRSLIETSYTLGRSEFETALLVVFPLAARGIIAGLALSFARALGEFGATVMVAGNIPGKTNTMALEIYNAVLYGDGASATMMVALFTLVSAALLVTANRLTRVVTR